MQRVYSANFVPPLLKITPLKKKIIIIIIKKKQNQKPKQTTGYSWKYKYITLLTYLQEVTSH